MNFKAKKEIKTLVRLADPMANRKKIGQKYAKLNSIVFRGALPDGSSSNRRGISFSIVSQIFERGLNDSIGAQQTLLEQISSAAWAWFIKLIFPVDCNIEQAYYLP